MLEVNSNDFIYLTKGDSGTINVTLQQGYTPEGGDNIQFYVRNARNLDNIRFALTSETGDVDTNVFEAGKGSITPIENTNNSWAIKINPAATENEKRNKYVYDIKLKRANGEIITFLGGGADKLSFVVT